MWEAFPQQLECFAEAAPLPTRGVVEVFRLKAQARGDVVADKTQPCQLFGGEGGRGVSPLLVFCIRRRDAAATLSCGVGGRTHELEFGLKHEPNSKAMSR